MSEYPKSCKCSSWRGCRSAFYKCKHCWEVTQLKWKIFHKCLGYQCYHINCTSAAVQKVHNEVVVPLRYTVQLVTASCATEQSCCVWISLFVCVTCPNTRLCTQTNTHTHRACRWWYTPLPVASHDYTNWWGAVYSIYIQHIKSMSRETYSIHTHTHTQCVVVRN